MSVLKEKKYSKKIVYLNFLILILILAGCASEDPNLVSPPPASKTVTFRLLNFCKNPLSLNIGETVETAAIPYNTISDIYQPPLGDSMYLRLKSNGVEIYKMTPKFRLIRDTKYIMVAMPIQTNLSNSGTFNQLVAVSTQLSLLLNDGKAYLTIVNAFPDSTVTFHVALGCPNGTVLADGLQYKAPSSANEIDAGNVTVSLMERKDSNSTLIDLYDFNLASKAEYALIIKPNEITGKPELWNIDQNSTARNPFQPAVVDSNRSSLVRVINFSTSPVTLGKIGTGTIGTYFANTISDYQKLSTCTSTTSDIVAAIVGGDTNSVATTNFDINKKYTILVFDSANNKGALTIIDEPVNLTQPLGNNCIVRVVHAAYMDGGMTLSLGARQDYSSIGYKSGEVLAPTITYGQISNPVILPAGKAPVTLFTALQPPQLILPALPDNDLQQGKSYLLILTNDNLGFSHITMIEDRDVNTDISDNFKLKQGVFTQIVHADPDQGIISFGLRDITSAKIYYQGFFATVVPVGDNQLTINGGSPQTFTIDNISKRGLIIVGKNFKIYNKSDLPIGTGNGSYRIRFINITNQRIIFNIETFSHSDTLDAGASSATPFTYGLPGNASISFYDMNNNQLYRLDGLEFSFGLNYSIIFNGSSAIVKTEF